MSFIDCVREFRKQYEYLANLEEGQQIFTGGATSSQVAITGVYTPPNTLVQKLWQKAVRLYYGETTKEQLELLPIQLDKASRYFQNYRFRTWEFVTKHAERYEELKQLRSTLEKAHTLGINTLKTTILNANYRFSNRPESEQQQRSYEIEIMSKSLGEFKTIAEKLLEREEAYLEISSNVSLCPINDCSLPEILFNNLYAQTAINSMEELNNLPLNVPFRLKREQVIPFFKEKFGNALVDEVLKLYCLDESSSPKADRGFSTDDFHAILIGIAANINIEDLVKLAASRKLASLDEESLGSLLLKIRTLDLQGFEISKETPYLNQIKGDLKFIKASLENEYDYRSSKYADESLVSALKKPFGYTEKLVRYEAYSFFENPAKEFRDGRLISYVDSDGRMCLQSAYKVYGSEGLYAMILLPALPKEGPSIPVQVVFRGSRCPASWIRDFNPREKRYYLQSEGPGGLSFDLAAPKILEKIRELLPKKLGSQKLVLEFMGHSLGASDSQRGVAAFLAALQKEDEEKIAAIKLFSYNPPGIEKDIASNFIAAIHQFSGIRFELNYFKTANDIVQWAGQCYLGFVEPSLQKPKNLYRSVFMMDRITAANSKGTSVQLTMENGSVSAAKNQAKISLDAHSKTYFSEHDDEDGTIKNGAWCKYIVTDSPDHAILPIGYDVNHLNEAGMESNEIVNLTLTPQFSYSKYKKT